MNIYLFCNSDIVNFVSKTNGCGERDIRVGLQKVLFCYFSFLGCFNCWWVRCGSVGPKVLFRAG